MNCLRSRPERGGNRKRTYFWYTSGMSLKVWHVWAETGEYSQWMLHHLGVFATEELAKEHATRLDNYDEVRVEADVVLTELPKKARLYEQSAHITPDGAEDPNLGYKRVGDGLFDTFSRAGTSGRWPWPHATSRSGCCPCSKERFPNDDRPRNAIQAGRDHANGLISAAWAAEAAEAAWAAWAAGAAGAAEAAEREAQGQIILDYAYGRRT